SYRWLLTMIFTVEEINRDPALLPNLTLGYLAADSCLAEGSTLSAALAMVTGQEEAVTGEQCTRAPSVFPNFLRTIPSDAFQAKAIVHLLSLMGWSWVGVVSGDDAYGISGVQLLLKELEGSDVCIDYLEVIPKSHTLSKIRRIIERIQSSKARVVVTFAISPDMEVFGISLAGTLGFALRQVDIQGLGFYLTQLSPGGQQMQPLTQTVWEEMFGCKFVVESQINPLSGPQCTGLEKMESQEVYFDVIYNVYKAVYAIANAIQDMLNCEPGKGCFGIKNGDVSSLKMVFPPPVSVKLMEISPSALQLPVSVCSESCPPGTRKAVQKGKPVCCYDCIPCATGEISNATVLSVAGATLSGTTLAAFFHHRDTPLVRANNSELSFLLLLSLKLCFLCALAFIGQPAPWSCMLRHTLFGISFVVCLACVLSKTVVVLVAFRATLPGSNVMRYFGPLQQRAGILLCTLVQVVVCVLWLVLAPPVPTESAGGELGARVVLLCAVGSVAGFSLVLGYIGLLASICFIMAFLARKLPDNFNEAKLIAFSMLIFCAVWIAFVPAYVSSPGKYTVAVEVFAILASSYGLLLCIFAPKCYIILLRPEKNIKKNMMAK
uniref:G-protein coupled receptors family 3 profile domain-containing protein n=1 Tax=Electrophorus electricus TaxID=8005 RepID=A0AAY5EBV5_ELEEL